MDLITGKVESINIGGSKAEGTVDANSTSYNESTVTANKELDFTSGKDTNIVGGKLSGEKVTGNVGGDLNIESKQDSNSYNEESKSGSLGLENDFGTGKVGITGGYSEGNIDSDYASVTDQSGIYAGNEGFDIYVEDNTDFKGGIISGDNADKNKLSTGTLTYEDIKNEAEYEAGSTGVNVNIDTGADYNERGVTPNIGMPAEDEAESTTKATVSEGEIEIRDKENQKQDLAGLNRDTQNALNKLGEIFDKDSIEERQELAGLFGELAYNEIHKLAENKEIELTLELIEAEKTGDIERINSLNTEINSWKDGGKNKILLHAITGGIMSEIASGDFLSGATGSGFNEAIMDLIKKSSTDPATQQFISAILGGAASEIITGNYQSGASSAASGTKNNAVFVIAVPSAVESLIAAAGLGGCVFLSTENGQKTLKDATGKIVATCDEFGNWAVNTGKETMEYIGNGWESFIYWIKGEPLPIDNIIYSNQDVVAQDWIAKNKKGAINREFPKQWIDKTLGEIDKAAKSGDKTAQKAKKLLGDKRFDKEDNRK